MLVLSLLIAPAEAGTLTLQKSGIVPVHAWVDGAARGKVRSARKATTFDLPEGPHEVWLTMDEPGVVTLCHGLVDVPRTGNVTVEFKAGFSGISCSGIREGWPNGPTAFRGALVSFRIDGELDAWVSIDGGMPLAFPEMPFELNLAPGKHTFVVYRDPDSGTVFDQGTVTLQPGQRLPVTCTQAGCTGFDAPPVYITEVYERREIVLATPGVTIDFDLDVGSGGASVEASVGGVGAKVDVRVDEP